MNLINLKEIHAILNNIGIRPEEKIVKIVKKCHITNKDLLNMGLSPNTSNRLRNGNIKHSISLGSYNKFMRNLNIKENIIMVSLGLPSDLKNDNFTIGKYFHSLKVAKHLSNKTVSESLGCSVAKIIGIEKGRVKKLLVGDIFNLGIILQGKYYYRTYTSDSIILSILSSNHGSKKNQNPKDNLVFLLPQLSMIKHNISIKELSKNSNVSISSIMKIFSNGNISFEKYNAIMKALGFSDNEILEALGIMDDNINNNMNSISKYIHKTRMDHNISLDLLSQKTGINRNSISHIELNKSSNSYDKENTSSNPFILNIVKILYAIYSLEQRTIK